MDSARIAALLHPFLERTLPEVQLVQISTYIDLLLRWNARVNLTAIRDPEEIVTRHFGESFFLARHVFPDSSPASARALDIGSGAGFPGLPLKIWAPSLALTLVESNHKKAAFLREAIRVLALTSIDVVAARAEALLETLPPFDLVTLRAVEKFDSLLPAAIALTSPAGRLALLIGSSQQSSLHHLSTTLRILDPLLIPQSHSRVLSILVREGSGR